MRQHARSSTPRRAMLNGFHHIRHFGIILRQVSEPDRQERDLALTRLVFIQKLTISAFSFVFGWTVRETANRPSRPGSKQQASKPAQIDGLALKIMVAGQLVRIDPAPCGVLNIAENFCRKRQLELHHRTVDWLGFVSATLTVCTTACGSSQCWRSRRKMERRCRNLLDPDHFRLRFRRKRARQKPAR